jgi:hypothetical protein
VSFDQHGPVLRRRLEVVDGGDVEVSPDSVLAHDHTATGDSSGNRPVEPHDPTFTLLIW